MRNPFVVRVPFKIVLTIDITGYRSLRFRGKGESDINNSLYWLFHACLQIVCSKKTSV